MKDITLGVDLGGTQIRAMICDADNNIIERSATLTLAEQGPKQVIERIQTTMNETVRTVGWQRIKSIGIGAPGPLDPFKGIVTQAPNLPGWDDVPLRDIINEATGVEAFLGNDANLAALGEQMYGAGKGCQNLVYMTVSTGIGGGIIINGELLLGSRGFAGEIGHHTILVDGPLCGCGNHGCLESLAAGPAIARRARQAVRNHPDSLILSMAGNDPEGITSVTVSQAAHQNDPLALEIVYTTGRYIGIGLGNLANILDTELFVIGGGVSYMGQHLFDAIQVGFEETALPAMQHAHIVPAKLGVDVGLWGAIALARKS